MFKLRPLLLGVYYPRGKLALASYKGSLVFSPVRGIVPAYNYKSLTPNSASLDRLNTAPIIWQGPTIDFLAGKSLSDLKIAVDIAIDSSLTVVLTGSQPYQDFAFSSPGIPNAFYYISWNSLSTPVKQVPSTTDGKGTGTYSAIDTLQQGNLIPRSISYGVGNFRNNNTSVPATDQYPSNSDFAITITMSVTVTISCTAIGSAACQQFCELPENIQQCYPKYYAQCFPDRIGTDKTCQQFFSNFTKAEFGPGPTSQIDAALASYCLKYSTFADLFNSKSTPPADLELCACHMPAAQYDAFREALIAKYPKYAQAIQELSLNEQCLVSQCANSSFPSLKSSRNCQIPCVNVALFNNTGSFDNSSINVNQQSYCANVTNTTNSWSWTVIAAIIAAVAVLVLAIVVFIVKRRKR